ncbi:MAG TPA: M48 family metalloprotease [Bryobacteraceae bacterium]|nr:M48 family metalloprotease [Bryobacteraceae bacterium]
MRWAAGVLCTATLFSAEPVFFSEKETALGKALAAEVEKQYPASRDTAAQANLNRVGANLARSAGLAMPFTFTLLGTAERLAGGLPGGHVYVSRGMLGRAATDAELSALLAHQMAHVVLRHGMRGRVYMGGRTGICPLGADYPMPLTLRARIPEYEKEAEGQARQYLDRAGLTP